MNIFFILVIGYVAARYNEGYKVTKTKNDINSAMQMVIYIAVALLILSQVFSKDHFIDKLWLTLWIALTIHYSMTMWHHYRTLKNNPMYYKDLIAAGLSILLLLILR